MNKVQCSVTRFGKFSNIPLLEAYASMRISFIFAVLFFCSFILLSNAQYEHKKVSVTEVTFNAPVSTLDHIGQNHEQAIVRTTAGTVYWSDNRGKDWTEITSSLPGIEESDQIQSVVVNPHNREIVVVGNKNCHYWISRNAGRSWSPIGYLRKRGDVVNTIVFHPTIDHFALVSVWSKSCELKERTECKQTILLTKDSFATLQEVIDYAIQFSWGDPNDKKHPSRILFTHHLVKSGNQPRKSGWQSLADFSYSDDLGYTHGILVKQGNKFLASDNYIFVAKTNDVRTQTVQLLVSSDNGESFRRAIFPFSKYLPEKSYTILDTTEGAVMIHVNHGSVASEGNNGVATGNVYISDAEGVRYSLSLPGNVRSQNGECEFDRIQGIDGVYISNFRDSPEEESMDDVERMEAAGDNNAIPSNARKSNSQKRGKIDQPIRTVISFDKGGVWSYLKPPKVDSLGNPIKCSDPSACFLHLHGISKFHMYAPFYSVTNATGIVIGTGTIGSRLTDDPTEINTFISQDAGLTWAEAHKGAFIYELGDHGGLIVMAEDTRSTNQVVFSWNEGNSWFDFNLGGDAISVDNVVTDPHFSTLDFLMYGSRGETGVLYHLDFSPLKHAPCRNPNLPDSVSSDYETWIPTDGRKNIGANEEGRCLLGRQVKYVRRKQTSECFNGQGFVRPVFKKGCACTLEDYECELGFTRSVGSLECRPDKSGYAHPSCWSARLVEVNAYRRVPGDTCRGGYVPEKVMVMCHERSALSQEARVILAGLLFFAVSVGVISLLTSPQVRSLLLNTGIDINTTAEYATALPTDVYSGKGGRTFAFSGRSSLNEPELGFIEAEEIKKHRDVPQLMKFDASSHGIEPVSIGYSTLDVQPQLHSTDGFSHNQHTAVGDRPLAGVFASSIASNGAQLQQRRLSVESGGSIGGLQQRRCTDEQDLLSAD